MFHTFLATIAGVFCSRPQPSGGSLQSPLPSGGSNPDSGEAGSDPGPTSCLRYVVKGKAAWCTAEELIDRVARLRPGVPMDVVQFAGLVKTPIGDEFCYGYPHAKLTLRSNIVITCLTCLAQPGGKCPRPGFTEKRAAN